MNEKAISIFVLAAVLLVGVVGFVNISSAETGAAVLTVSCCCDIKQYDYYGNIMGTQVQKIRVRSMQNYNDQGCTNRCDAMFGTGPIVVTGRAC